MTLRRGREPQSSEQGISSRHVKPTSMAWRHCLRGGLCQGRTAVPGGSVPCVGQAQVCVTVCSGRVCGGCRPLRGRPGPAAARRRDGRPQGPRAVAASTGCSPCGGAPRGLEAACSARPCRADLDGAGAWRSRRTPPRQRTPQGGTRTGPGARPPLCWSGPGCFCWMLRRWGAHDPPALPRAEAVLTWARGSQAVRAVVTRQ